MDFRLTPEQEMIRDMVRDFAEKNIKPAASQLDEREEFPYENVKKMADLGLMGMNIPVQYGGSDVGVVAYSLAITEIAKACASHAVTTAVTNMVAEVIHEFGSEMTKENHIPKLCNGQYPAGAFAITEPHTGSDAANIRTMAVADGDSFVLNGSKALITNGGQAGVVVVWAVTDREARKKGERNQCFSDRKRNAGFCGWESRKQDGPPSLPHV